MAAVATHLVDNSALARLHLPGVGAVLVPIIEAGLVATCAVIEMEVLWSTRSAAEFRQVRADRQAGYEWLPIEDPQWRRAMDVQEQLWSTGRVRSVPLPDLLIAAVAEQHGLTVLHYDQDFDLIAAVTGQPTAWVVPRSSVP
jgi:predicted nucleic acid-binding protein